VVDFHFTSVTLQKQPRQKTSGQLFQQPTGMAKTKNLK